MAKASTSSHQAKYELLPNITQPSCIKERCVRWSAVFILLFLILFIAIGVAYYEATHLKNNLILPRNYESPEIPDFWVSRAKLYSESTRNNYTMKETNKKTFYKSNANHQEYRLVCYYSIPTDKRKQKVLRYDQVDPGLCTHINVGFLSINNCSLIIDDYSADVIKGVINLKEKNPDLKVLISIGGAGDDSFPQMVLNHSNRKIFIKSILNATRTFRVDGIDLDWEFPGRDPSYDPKQRIHFTQLLHEIRNEINRQSEKHKFLLSVAVPSPQTFVDMGYDVTYVNDYVDYVNLMSYDFHFFTKVTPWTGINSPLYKRSSENGIFTTMNINSSAYYWVTSGMDKSKINIGLPTYGHSFTLENADNNGIESPAYGYGKLGTNGFASYNDICMFMTSYKARPIFDVESRSPYVTKLFEWISYDDIQSLTYKTEYIKNNNFGGAMVYSLNSDDHQGICETSSNKSPQSFPLTRKIRNVLFDDVL